MAILDKVMFWKKKKEFGELKEAPLPGEEELKFGEEPREFRPPEEFEVKPTAPPLGMQQAAGADISKDFEILSAKLDAVKASLESINQRLANLERIASESEKKKRTW